MRIVHAGKYYPPYRGGIEHFTQMLAAGLAARGEAVTVVACNTSASARERMVDGVEVREAARWGVLRSLPLCPGYPALVRSALPGIVHAHGPNPLADWTVRGLSPDVPVVMTYHSDVIQQRLARTLLGPLLRGTLRRCRRIVTTWPGQAEASDWLRPVREKCVTIPLAVDPAAYETPAGPDALPDALRDWEPGYFLFVGRMAWYKGVELLLEALAGLPATARLALVGNGPRRAAWEARAAELGLADRCRWLGDCSESEKIAALRSARAVVLPSRAPAEVFGVVQLEAMAAGRAVVNTALPTGVPWVARDGREALTVPPGDVPALREACRVILEDPGRADALGAAGRARVAACFTRDRMIDAYRELYAECE